MKTNQLRSRLAPADSLTPTFGSAAAVCLPDENRDTLTPPRLASAAHAEPCRPVPTVESRHRQRVFSGRDPAVRFYLRAVDQVDPLPDQAELKLAARIKQGDKEARDQIIRANLRLVVAIARDYEGAGLPLLDLISEGNLGLVEAVDRFDPAKGGKLSTCASVWIRRSIERVLARRG